MLFIVAASRSAYPILDSVSYLNSPSPFLVFVLAPKLWQCVCIERLHYDEGRIL